MAESMETLPSFRTPTRYSSMVGGPQPGAHRLRIQLRASPCAAPPGRTFWSSPVQLDALGAAAVVSVPAAMAARAGTPLDADSAIVVSLTAVEVRALSTCLLLH